MKYTSQNKNRQLIFIFLDSMIQIIQYLCNVSLTGCRFSAGS